MGTPDGLGAEWCIKYGPFQELRHLPAAAETAQRPPSALCPVVMNGARGTD